ncbi:MAG: glycine--tRNA ligase subunit beta, partial [Synergistaceae bacterium]|nr:glycine--tRNA ligase subunit beta [Synergistaceae bacterium]
MTQNAASVYKNVLLEIGTEEIPSRFLPDMIAAMEKITREEMLAARVNFHEAAVYATPRRLVILLNNVSEKQEDIVASFKGPSWKNAFNEDGEPTPAAFGFAKSKGMSVGELGEQMIDGVKYLCAETKETGKNSMDLFPQVFCSILGKLVFPKNMYWKHPTVRFARPVRWILALADKDIIEFEYGGIKSGRVTSGHRFMGAKKIEIHDAAKFMEELYDNYVVLDQEKRKQRMLAGIAQLESGIRDVVELDPEVIEENLYLVEYPVPFSGSFDARYLDIPQEVLITSMKKNQKYFAVRSKDGKLVNNFVGVSNNRAIDMKEICSGNEKVLRARLEDAAFFWHEDLKFPLAANVEKLKSIVFQEKLGTVYDKVIKTQSLALELCKMLGKEDISNLVERAAYLSKADLVSNMVYEFPELQGIMGREYALKNGESPRVAAAIYEQYLPKFAGDDVPGDDVGAVLGIADRTNIIVMCHKVGFEPTGSQDPYGLRRAARCINEIIWELGLDADVFELVKKSAAENDVSEEIVEKVFSFLKQRMLMQFKEKGFDHGIVSLSISVTGARPLQALRFIEALAEVRSEKWFEELIMSAVRVKNILSKTEPETGEGEINPELFVKDAEKKLFDEV